MATYAYDVTAAEWLRRRHAQMASDFGGVTTWRYSAALREGEPTERKTVGVTLVDVSNYGYPLDAGEEWPPENLVDAIAWFQAALDAIPAACRHTATMKIRTYDESSSVSIEIAYERPETDEEWAERKALYAEAVRVAAHEKEIAEQRERATYEALKAKYEGRAK
jgi:hypothetical protein